MTDEKAVLYIPNETRTNESEIEFIESFVRWAYSNDIKTIALPLSMAADVVSARSFLSSFFNSINIVGIFIIRHLVSNPDKIPNILKFIMIKIIYKRFEIN